MTIKEQRQAIRVGLEQYFSDYLAGWPDHSAQMTEDVLAFLTEKGAVLKVEREMPIPKDWIGDFNPGIFTEQVLIAAGFTATAPLTEKK